jgi:DNA invertase Pin-like site-specific DNA recombinase
VEAERQQLHGDTQREIDAILNEFHAALPRGQAKCIGAVYARYSSRYQHSVADQVRGCLQAALQHGVFVPREHVFFDLAVRGAKQRRPGLDRLKEALARKAVHTLLILTTNRLSRKTYKSLQFVEEEVVGRGVRCVFVKSGVDTADEKRWRMLLNHFAAIDEFVTSMYADNIRVAQEGLFHDKRVFGTITFGFRAKEVAGPPTRQKRPRCEYEVDPDAAPWVVRIFRWFVEDRLSLAEIIRRLNADPSAPLGPKAVSGRWTRLAVKLLLANPRYRGCWSYGRTQTVWQVKQDYSRQLPRERPLGQEQFEDLRVVPDALWYAAQARLAALPANGGRRPADGDRRSRPRLLNGLFVCAAHGRRLYVGGADGKFMLCPTCQGLPAAERPLFTQLNRVMALRLTCARLAELVRADPALAADVAAAFKKEADRGQQTDPEWPAAVRRRLEKLSQQIRFVMANPGETQADRDESAAELRRLRGERAEAEAEAAALDAASDRPKAVPSQADVERVMNDMGDVLAAAAAGDADESAAAARQVVELLTGGRIELEQQGERAAHRGWLRGRFSARLLGAVAEKVGGLGRLPEAGGDEVLIDYREPGEAERWADRVKALYDRGLLLKAIAAELGIGRALARKALDAWCAREGLPPLPDGRSRRAGLTVKHLRPPLYRAQSDAVKRLMDEGLLLHEIAARLEVDVNTVTAAKDYWYESRGLTPPDGRSRWKGLDRKSSPRG